MRARLAPAFFQLSVACARLHDAQNAKTPGFLDEICASDVLPNRSTEVAEQLATLDFAAYRETKARAWGPLIRSLDQAIDADFGTRSVTR